MKFHFLALEWPAFSVLFVEFILSLLFARVYLWCAVFWLCALSSARTTLFDGHGWVLLWGSPAHSPTTHITEDILTAWFSSFSSCVFELSFQIPWKIPLHGFVLNLWVHLGEQTSDKIVMLPVSVTCITHVVWSQISLSNILHRSCILLDASVGSFFIF